MSYFIAAIGGFIFIYELTSIRMAFQDIARALDKLANK